MGFLKKLFGGTAPTPEKSAWHDIKRVARDNEQRRRRALEQTPRASPAENAARAARLRSIHQLSSAYNEMPHAEFCDVVTAAVRAGNLSDEDASYACTPGNGVERWRCANLASGMDGC
jgi:hypothetical protein